MRISLPAWLRVFVPHPLSLSRILSFRYPNASFWDCLHTDGRPRYFPVSLVLGIWSSSSMALQVLRFAPLLNIRLYFASFMLWPDTLHYFIGSFFSRRAYSTIPYMKNIESFTKKRWWSSRQPLLSLIMCSFSLWPLSLLVERGHSLTRWIGTVKVGRLVSIPLMAAWWRFVSHWRSHDKSVLLYMHASTLSIGLQIPSSLGYLVKIHTPLDHTLCSICS